MQLYTFQKLFVWESLVELGYYHPYNLFEHESFADDHLYPWSFIQSYQWLREIMLEKKNSHIANNEYMIWSWYQWNGKNRKQPDKRYACVYNYYENEPYVMLELEIDPSRVLLSDYDLWHWVLNYWYIAKPRKSNHFQKQYNFYRIKPLKNEGDRMMRESWHAIFDFKASRSFLEISQKRQQIQATFFELFYTDVKKVHFFENKKCINILSIDAPI